MRKTLIALVITMLALPLVALPVRAQDNAVTATISAQEEKIPAPAEMKNFEKIRKEGNTLFGVRKMNKEDNKVEASSSLEKISHPKEISLFEKIKKIGSALWGMRKEKAPKPVYITTASTQCVKTAIDKKDLAIKNVITSHSQQVVSAIDARSTCQKAALDKNTAEEQRDANKICADTFKKAADTNNGLLERTKNDAQKNYKSDLKACSASQAATSTSATTGEIELEDGSNTGQ